MEMRRIQKGGNWYVGMKVYNGVGAESDVATVISARPSVHYIKASQRSSVAEKTEVHPGVQYQGYRKTLQGCAGCWHGADIDMPFPQIMDPHL
jgi:hypothetical protein